MREEFEDIFRDEEYSDLVSRYEEMLKKDVKYFFDVYEFENIIDYYIDTNKANLALNAIRYASQQHPYSSILQLKKAQVLVEKGLAKQALQILDEIEKIESSNSDFYLLKGNALNIIGRYNEAEKNFDIAIQLLYDDKVDVIHAVAQSFEQIGRYKTAIKYLLEAFRYDNQNISLLYDIGYSYEKIGQINKSIEYYNLFLDQDPFSENAWYNLGIIYYKAEKYDKAIESYEFALAINPDFSLAYFNLANAYSEKGEYHKAILNYKEYMQYDGESVEILTYIGDCYESIGEFDMALKYFDQAIARDNYFADAFYGKANVLFRMDKVQQALPLTEKALLIDDLNPEYYFLLGNIYNELRGKQKSPNSF